MKTVTNRDEENHHKNRLQQLQHSASSNFHRTCGLKPREVAIMSWVLAFVNYSGEESDSGDTQIFPPLTSTCQKRKAKMERDQEHSSGFSEVGKRGARKPWLKFHHGFTVWGIVLSGNHSTDEIFNLILLFLKIHFFLKLRLLSDSTFRASQMQSSFFFFSLCISKTQSFPKLFQIFQ